MPKKKPDPAPDPQALRLSYLHVKCGGDGTFGIDEAQVANSRKKLGKITCIHCGDEFPATQFVWSGTDEKLR